MSDTTRDSYIGALVERCEQEMIFEGWLQGDIPHDELVKLPSYQTCIAIDRALRANHHFVGYQGALTQGRRASLGQAASTFTVPRSTELLIEGVINETLLRYEHSTPNDIRIGYFGVYPLLDSKTDMNEPPYAGPFLYGMAGIAFEFLGRRHTLPHTFVRLSGLAISSAPPVIVN